MPDRTKEELEKELEMIKFKEDLIKTGHTIWANKIVEKVVMVACGLILTGALVAMLNLIYTYNTIKK